MSEIDQPEVLQVLLPIWTTKHETAKRVAQRIKAMLDVAKSKGFHEGENPVTTIRDARVLPTVKQKVQHHKAMRWKDVPAFYAELATKDAMAAKALMFTCLTASRTSEFLKAKWDEFDFDELLWTIPAERMKADQEHRAPLTEQMLAIIEPTKAVRSDVAFEGQKRHRPMSNMAMLMLLRRMKVEGVTVYGFRPAFRDWASEQPGIAREVAEMSLAHMVGSEVERAYDMAYLVAWVGVQQHLGRRDRDGLRGKVAIDLGVRVDRLDGPAYGGCTMAAAYAGHVKLHSISSFCFNR